jgi:hypothetical protein
MTRCAADERGSTLIVGLCMGVILLLGCMHLLEVTKAILARALGQNVADAIALEGAVWHAQGMNLIAVLNLIMAAVMALFVAIRITEILIATAIVLTALALVAAQVAAFFSFGGAQAAVPVLQQLLQQFSRAEQAAMRLEQRVSTPIFTTLAYAANTERLVAAAFPYVSLARPITASAGLKGHNFATSLFPTFVENIFSKAPNVPIAKGKNGRSVLMFKNDHCGKDVSDKDYKEKCRGFEVETSFPARMGAIPQPSLVKYYVGKLDAKIGKVGIAPTVADVISGGVGSLPVQEEDFYQVCGRGAEFIAAVFGRIFNMLGLPGNGTQKLGDIMAATFGSLPNVMCKPLPEVKKGLDAQVQFARELYCKEQRENFDGNPDNKGKKFDQTKCEKDAKDKGKVRDPVDPESIKIARLWAVTGSPAHSPFLHVWSFSPIAGDYQVEPANAMGEFRHTCDGAALDAARRGCGENSMFSPGWYGKLVPVRSLGEELAANFGEIMAGWLGRALGKAITGVVDRVLKNVKIPGSGTNNKYLQMIERQIGAIYGTLAIGPKTANGWWNRRLLSNEIINALGVNNWRVIVDKGYPEHLH